MAWLLGTDAGPSVVTETRSEVPPEPTPLTIPSRADLPLTDSTFTRTIAVYRAVQLLTLGASQLSLDVWRGSDLIERPSLVRRPDIKLRDLSAFTKRTVASLALTGNAYWRVARNARNEASNLEVLNPHECEPQKDGRLSIAGVRVPLESHEFQHLGMLWIPGEMKALGPIQAARMELTGAHNATQYGAAFLKSGDVPSGVLKTDQVLSPTQAAQYKTQWHARQAHEVAVLGQGLDYKPVLLSPKDAQFLETRQFDTTAIARLFGIPAHLFLASVEGSSLTYSNMAQADLAFMRWTVAEYTREIETAMTAVLPSTQTARFNLDAVLRPDAPTRSTVHRTNLEAGWMSVNEVREIEGLPPVPGGDTYSAPVTPAPAPEEPNA